MVWGLASESASTLPEASITVARASALPASSFTSCARGTLLSCYTRAANSRVFWVREPVISWRREFSQSRRRVRSRVTVVAAITSRNATSSLANTLLRTAEPHWGPSLGNFKTISGAAHGAQVARIFRIAFNLFAKFAHIDIHR